MTANTASGGASMWMRFSAIARVSCPGGRALNRMRTEPAGYGPQTPTVQGGPMATCEVCGNDYDKAMEVTVAGKTHTFDSFECAIHAIAPTCDHCGCRV